MPQLGPEIKTCRRTDPTTSIEGPTFPYTRYDVLPVTEENDGWIPFHTCALSLKSEPNPIVVKRASGRANELTRACRRPHDNALVLCFVLSSPTAICFCRSWRCKRRTEASHRTLLGRALCQASQQMPSLPQQASSCADFPAGHGNPSPSWLPLYHMVGNQDPFFALFTTTTTVSQYCPRLFALSISTVLYIQSTNTLPCLCCAVQIPHCSITGYVTKGFTGFRSTEKHSQFSSRSPFFLGSSSRSQLSNKIRHSGQRYFPTGSMRLVAAEDKPGIIIIMSWNSAIDRLICCD